MTSSPRPSVAVEPEPAVTEERVPPETPNPSRTIRENRANDSHVRVYRCEPPGGVPDGHPGLTSRVVAAIAIARMKPQMLRAITDECGPHQHHWEPILWWCRGCGAFDE